MSNPGECAPLDKSVQPVIMKIPKAPRQAVFLWLCEGKMSHRLKKPSLGRVAVSAFDTNRDGEPKNMERQCDRHQNHLLSEVRQNRLSLCWSLGVHKNHF